MSKPSLSVIPPTAACRHSEPPDSGTADSWASPVPQLDIEACVRLSDEILVQLPTRPALSPAAFRLMCGYRDCAPLLASAAWTAPSGNSADDRHKVRFRKDSRKVNRRELIIDSLRVIWASIEAALAREEDAAGLSKALTDRIAVYVGLAKVLTQSDLVDCKIRRAGFDEDHAADEEASSSVSTDNEQDSATANLSSADSNAAKLESLLAQLGALGFLKSEAERRATA